VKAFETLDRPQENPTPVQRPSLGAIVLLFLKLGALGFGGGMAVIAMMETELVQRRKLIDHKELLHGLALGQILGSFATNAAFFVGYRFFGILGGLACAAAFMAPSVALVILLSWLYFSFHTIPALQTAMQGLGPVVIALILSAAWSMGRKALRSWPAGLLAAAALVLTLLKVNSLAALALGAMVGLWAGRDVLSGMTREIPKMTTAPALLPLGSLPLAAVPVTASLLATAWTFLKVGFVFFGGGFVLVPVLHHKLVVTLGWLTPKEFIDGVALSNLTPGPIAVLATFAGFRVQGVLGALVATAALFAPALVLMGLLSHFYSRLKDLHHAQNLLAGLTPTVVGLILGAALLLAPGALHALPSFALFGVALLLLVRFRWHPAFVLALGAAAGVIGFVR
jgi:chromate transporter